MKRNRGMTIVELIVVIGVGGAIGGMIFSALIETDRTTEDVIARQQMRQEALLLSQSVERIIRFRVPSDQLASITSRGGAAATPAAGGTTSTLPQSVRDTLATTPTVTSDDNVNTTDSRTTTPIDPSTAPPSVKSLLTTGSATAPPIEKFAADDLVIHSFAAGNNHYLLATAIRNHNDKIIVQRGDTGTVPAHANRHTLNANADKYRATISFRYASEFDGIKAKWAEESTSPKLVEYRIKVWPRSAKETSFEESVDKAGSPLRYEYVSAVELR